MKKRIEINVACHVFNAYQQKSSSDNNKRRSTQLREFKVIQQPQKEMQLLLFAIRHVSKRIIEK